MLGTEYNSYFDYLKVQNRKNRAKHGVEMRRIIGADDNSWEVRLNVRKDANGNPMIGENIIVADQLISLLTQRRITVYNLRYLEGYCEMFDGAMRDIVDQIRNGIGSHAEVKGFNLNNLYIYSKVDANGVPQKTLNQVLGYCITIKGDMRFKERHTLDGTNPITHIIVENPSSILVSDGQKINKRCFNAMQAINLAKTTEGYLQHTDTGRKSDEIGE